jgi:hypothetical protein
LHANLCMDHAGEGVSALIAPPSIGNSWRDALGKAVCSVPG